MIRQIIEWIAILFAVFMLSLLWINNAHARQVQYEFKHYSYVELNELADHPDKYNSDQVQVRGKVLRIDEYVGPYGGEYEGLVLGNITIMSYKSDLHEMIVPGDVILVDGTFHRFSRFAGSGYNYFIAVHRIERLQ